MVSAETQGARQCIDQAPSVLVSTVPFPSSSSRYIRTETSLEVTWKVIKYTPLLREGRVEESSQGLAKGVWGRVGSRGILEKE